MTATKDGRQPATLSYQATANTPISHSPGPSTSLPEEAYEQLPKGVANNLTNTQCPLPHSFNTPKDSNPSSSRVNGPTGYSHVRRRSQSQSISNALLDSGLGTSSEPMTTVISGVSRVAGRDRTECRNTRAGSSIISSTASSIQQSLRKRLLSTSAARHTLGLFLLGCVVFLWTLSNFLGSSIFADDTYAKPFFLTYLNTSIFMFAMLPSFLGGIYRRRKSGTLRADTSSIFSWSTIVFLIRGSTSRTTSKASADVESAAENNDMAESEAFLKPASAMSDAGHASSTRSQSSSNHPASSHLHLTDSITSRNRRESISSEEDSEYLPILQTARLSLAFAFLWFGANYFAMSCLQHTTVASTTILTSTSSIWTLLIGALTRTEKFTWRKLCGVLGSLAGIIIISHADFSSGTDDGDVSEDAESGGPAVLMIKTVRMMTRSLGRTKRALDDFPEKSATELALGDGMALLSAVIYGAYTITLKRSTLSAQPRTLHMPTFFGLVGVFNMVLLLPLFPVLHMTGIETFQLPPTGQVWTVLLSNSVSSFVSDLLWAYAMLFTGPLIVTVGLSLTIPLSLVGEMLVQAKHESWVYWLGAFIVVGSFVFVEREESKEGGSDKSSPSNNHIFDSDTSVMNEDAHELLGSDIGNDGAREHDIHHIPPEDSGLLNNTDFMIDTSDDDDDDEDDRTRDRLNRQIHGVE